MHCRTSSACWCVVLFLVASPALAAPCHPSLLTTPSGLALARQRVRDEAWAQRLFARVVADARQLETASLPVFDKEWWRAASKKRWQDIYPEVHQHTGSGVAGPMRGTTDAAIVYAISGERRYAEAVRKVLLHYADYEFVARHPDVGMNWSGWCLAGLQAYDLIHDTLSAADRSRIDDFFARALAAVQENDRDWIREGWGGRFNNHYAHHKLFIGSYGLFFGEADCVDYALNSEEGFRELIENATRDDGLWFESSLNYHFTGFGPIAEFASELANAGHAMDLWNQRFANGRRLRDFLTAPIATLFPDETIPTIGDTYGRRAAIRGSRTYFAAFSALADERLGWALRDAEWPATALFLPRLPQGAYSPPEQRTRLWPEHGYIALRSQEGAEYWQGDGYSAFLSFDLDGIHSHHDKFGLMVYGHRAHLAIDPEALASVPHAFSSRIQRELNRETICHNTLMVDGKNHGALRDKLAVVDFINGADCKLASIADWQSAVYPGVRLLRTVAVTADYVLDVFQAASDENHTYDYLFHSYDDRGEFAVAGAFESIDLGAAPPWNWLKNARQRPVETAWTATARQGELEVQLGMAGEPGTRLITCDFPRSDDLQGVAIPMLMVRRTGRSATFAAVLRAERGPLPEVQISLRPDRHGLWRASVDCRGTSRDFSFRKLE